MRNKVTAFCLVILWGANVTVMAEEPPAPLWGRNLRGGSAVESLSALAPTRDGGFLAVGKIYEGTWELDGVKVTSSAPKGKRCAVLCRFDANGRLLWARGPSVSSADSEFTAAAEGKDGRIYAAGLIVGKGPFTFAPDATVSGSSSSEVGNPLLVAFDASGRALWARSTIAGNESCHFNAAAVDDAGNVFVSGYLGRQETFSFGPGVEAKGTAVNSNILVAKYDADGKALWARSTDAGWNDSYFTDICVDDAGCAYAVGFYSGPTVTIGGVQVAGYQGRNAFVAKYDPRGAAVWARMAGSGFTPGRPGADTSFFGIVPSGTGDFVLTGRTSGRAGTCFFDAKVGVVCLNKDFNNSFVLRMDGEGRFTRAASCGESPDSNYLTEIAVGRGGEYVVGGCAYGKGQIAFGDIRTGVNLSAQDPNSRTRTDISVAMFGFEAGGSPSWALSPENNPDYSTVEDLCFLTGGELVVLGYAIGSGMVFGSYTAVRPEPGRNGDTFLAAFAGRRERVYR